MSTIYWIEGPSVWPDPIPWVRLTAEEYAAIKAERDKGNALHDYRLPALVEQEFAYQRPGLQCGDRPL